MKFSFVKRIAGRKKNFIIHKGNKVFLSKKIKVTKGDKFELKFLSTNSKYLQGVKVAGRKNTNVEFEVNGFQTSKGLIIRQDTAPRKIHFEIKNINSGKAEILVHNIWIKSEDRVEFGQGNAGMIIEDTKDGWIFRCNDEQDDDDFDDLIFTLQKVT